MSLAKDSMTSESAQGSFRDQSLRAAAMQAARAQAQFSAYMEHNPLDALFFTKLISICDGKMAESIVLWDLLKHAHERGLQAHKDASSSDYIDSYGSRHCSVRAYRRAVTDLIAEGLIDELPRGHTVAKRFFLNWPVLAEALASDVDMKLPGLRSLAAK